MPSDKLTVQIYDDSKKLVEGEITMTFGLLNTLARITGDINRVGVIDIDPDLAEEVLDEVLVPRSASGKAARPVDYTTPDLPPEQAHLIFSWVKEHVMDFFLRRLKDTADLMSRNTGRMSAIGSFLDSSKASASKTA
jgi:hypothetical protein